MKRAGGWILGLVVVATMAATGWFLLRRALYPEMAQIVLLESEAARRPTADAIRRGAEFALEEVSHRAGRFKIQLTGGTHGIDRGPGPWIGTSEWILFQGDQQPLPLMITTLDNHPFDTSRTFQITPSLARQGEAAAAWARRKGATRVFVIYDDLNPRSAAIGDAFWTAVKASGLVAQRCALNNSPDSKIDRVDDLIAIGPDLLFYAGEEAPYSRTYQLFSKLREQGFKGPLIAGDADPEVSFLATRPDLVEGTYLVSPFAPAPPELATRMGFVPGPHVTAGYYAMKAALEAIDHANSVEPDDLRRAAAKLPYFDAQGKAALRKCALYVARKGRFEFVELLE